MHLYYNYLQSLSDVVKMVTVNEFSETMTIKFQWVSTVCTGFSSCLNRVRTRTNQCLYILILRHTEAVLTMLHFDIKHHQSYGSCFFYV